MTTIPPICVGRFSDPWDNLWWVHKRIAQPSNEEMATAATTPEAAKALRYVEETLETEMKHRGSRSVRA
jgi:hypothetical protein